MAGRSGEREEDKNRKKHHTSQEYYGDPQGWFLGEDQGQPRFYINQDIISTATMARAEPANQDYDESNKIFVND